MANAVGIVLFANNQNGELSALLSQRTDADSFARRTQVLAHGKLTLDECSLPNRDGFKVALLSKVEEEIGLALKNLVAANEDGWKELTVIKQPEKTVITYGLKITTLSAEEVLEIVVKGADVGRVLLCTNPTEIQILKKSHKTTGVPAGEMRMFPNELEAVTKGFELYANFLPELKLQLEPYQRLIPTQELDLGLGY